MTRFLGEVEVQASGCPMLAELASFPANVEGLRIGGVVEVVAKMLRAFAGDAEVRKGVCAAMVKLAIHGDRKRKEALQASKVMESCCL